MFTVVRYLKNKTTPSAKSAVVALLGLSLAFSACVPSEDSNPAPSTTSAAAPSTTSGTITFTGASKAANLDGTRIQISWSAGTGAIAGYTVYQVNGGINTALASVPSSATNFTASGLTSGTYYTFLVRAFDATGLPDSNTNSVSALAYSGITSLTASTAAGFTVNYANLGSATSLNIYCAPTRTGTYALVGTVTSAGTSSSLTGLKSGTTYKCKAMAVGPTGAEDTNTATTTGQTTSLTSTEFQGALVVKAFGAAPTNYNGSISSTQVKITWNGFTGATGSTSYSLVRVGYQGTLDTTTTTPCTSLLTTSCQVCGVTGAGAQTCTDNAVAVSPQVYDYSVVLVNSGWPEETPIAGDSSYRIKVPIPPTNMVLVQRDSVNIEICSQMGRTSDPLNHNRCAYTGLGAVPYSTNAGNAALSLPTGYYDFGYDLFVDRFGVGCNWTPGSSTGKCGALHTSGDCNGNGVPAGTIGVDGNIYYDYGSGNCYANISGSWYAAPAMTTQPSIFTTAYKTLMYTNAPSSTSHVPPLVNIFPADTWGVCQSIIDPNYGPKRLLRRREYIAASAFPDIFGEPGYMTNAQIQSMEYTAGSGTVCNTNTHAGVSTTAGWNGAGYELSRVTAGAGPDSFTIGSTGTSNCVSRYGIQDLIGNTYMDISDGPYNCNGGTDTCSLGASEYDSGNRDLNGFSFDGVQGSGGSSFASLAGQVSLNGFTTTYIPNFSVPLGLPMAGTDSGNVNSIGGGFLPKLHSNVTLVPITTTATYYLPMSGGYWGGSGAGNLFGRWSLYDTPSNTFANEFGFTCAVPAE